MSKFSFSQFIEGKKLSARVACIAVVCCSSAFAQSSIDDYLTSLKETSLIDDVNVEDDVLVVWPSPNLQSSLDYDSLGEQLCGNHKKYRYLVVWFMDSSRYRSTKKMELLESYICIK
jgi:hypothetical protein